MAANFCVGVRTHAARSIAQVRLAAVERSGDLLADCLGKIEPLVSSSLAQIHNKSSRTQKLLSLQEAETLFGVDREILLAAMVNHQLPSSFSDKGYQIKYKDLEQFVDRYFYRKNFISGTYSPNL